MQQSLFGLSDMNGIILINAFSKAQKWVSQATRLRDEFSALGVSCEIIKNDGFRVFIKDGAISNELPDSDFIVYLDKDKYISRMLQVSGKRLFNPHEAIRDCDDKFETYICLAGCGLTLPDTLPGLMCYRESEQITDKQINTVIDKLGLPVIVKTSYGSYGWGVYKAESFNELYDITEKLKLTPHLFQKYISESCGRDVRIIVIGGSAVGAMERVSGGDFRSNIELGGVGKAIEAPDRFIKAAEKCAEILGLDYCGVDLLEGKNNIPVVCEVNSNAFFEGFEACTGINVARLYCEYIIRTVGDK